MHSLRFLSWSPPFRSDCCNNKKELLPESSIYTKYCLMQLLFEKLLVPESNFRCPEPLLNLIYALVINHISLTEFISAASFWTPHKLSIPDSSNIYHILHASIDNIVNCHQSHVSGVFVCHSTRLIHFMSFRSRNHIVIPFLLSHWSSFLSTST